MATTEQLAKQIKTLKIILGVLIVIIVIFGIKLFNTGESTATELTLQRLNIVDGNGKLRMVISNKQKQHPGIIDGKTLSKRERDAGMIFFNDDGDECGGLIYSGNKKEAGMAYSVDQFKNDQIMQLQYSQDNEDKKSKSYGFKLWDRSDDFTAGRLISHFDSLNMKEGTKAYREEVARLKAKGYLGTERLFLGRNKAGQTGLFLSDGKGRLRLKIFIDSLNRPLIQTLGEKGEVISTLNGAH
ncbi:hypothetical protein [Mucilaginibacter phyllosphaerae]|uniref:Uncharacterized protein n=1 Tax=Mucilaginibacter phyllosphaerae TaxID=1812349 RepID=A0A4Y8AFX2_9SPHI|nr:hypothetical protein [Mucilaginibacter phyllosphaerae]MBB3968689.1 hypothetical protein [Mucilaginibacter phyllosphaerae]TEW67674.1 hypothetical protein E2R65_06695 [Mucilaginibacter phyllosphaerae]GGH14460.1 hypothetical protein GCM10007352_22600 [Mucilaginibacter phyllosphaerae]